MAVFFRDLDREDICGYLGNNLFQLIAAYSLATKNNDEAVIPDSWKYIGIFDDRFFVKLPKNVIEKEIKSEYNEPFFHYQEISYQDGMNLNGYYQSWKYFEGINVQSLLKPSQNLVDTILKTKNKDLDKTYDEILSYSRVTSLHVRRQDYLKFSNHFVNLGDTFYYHQSIEKLDPITDYFLIFSNDIPWCRENFKGEKFIFSDTIQNRPMGNDSGPFDLYLGSMCRNHIIANSSYSYWQAMLNDSPYKKVIAPKLWFGPALSHDIGELIPGDWIKT